MMGASASLGYILTNSQCNFDVVASVLLPFLQSRPSALLMTTSAAIMEIGVSLPFTLLGRYLGFTALPLRYVPHLALTLVCYVLLTQSVKAWLLHRGFIR